MSRLQILTGLVLSGSLGWGAAPVAAEAAELHGRRLLVSGAQAAVLGGAHLGVTIAELDPSAARESGLEQLRGARVVEVSPKSPAELAGLRPGDVIVAFDGEGVRSISQLSRLVRETPPGRPVALEVVRSGERVSLSAELEEGGLARFRRRIEPHLRDFDFDLEDFHFALPDVDLRFHGWRGRTLGIRFQEIEGQLAEYFGVEGRGVLVTRVAEDSPAATAGLRAGDVLQELGGEPIRDAGDLRRSLRRVEPGEAVALEVLRRGEARELELVPSGEKSTTRKGEAL